MSYGDLLYRILEEMKMIHPSMVFGLDDIHECLLEQNITAQNYNEYKGRTVFFKKIWHYIHYKVSPLTNYENKIMYLFYKNL